MLPNLPMRPNLYYIVQKPNSTYIFGKKPIKTNIGGSYLTNLYLYYNGCALLANPLCYRWNIHKTVVEGKKKLYKNRCVIFYVFDIRDMGDER